MNWFIALLGSTIIALTLLTIYLFATQAIRSWEGPVTVNVNELAKRERDNNLGALAFAEISRLIRLRPDPIASNVAINWQQKLSPAPRAPTWHQFAKNLFEAAFEEASFGVGSWRDQFDCWVGDMYLGPSTTVPLVVFVFNNQPDIVRLDERIDGLERNLPLASAAIFAVFDADSPATAYLIELTSHKVQVWSRRALQRSG
jgi:hypothetical protein